MEYIFGGEKYMKFFRKGKVRGVLLPLILLVFVSVHVYSGGKQETDEQKDAKTEKEKLVRLDAGFRQEESLENLIPNNSWQYVNMGTIFWQLVYDKLWNLGPAPDYKAIPALATSWETEDNKTWTYHLREGVKFHDGVEFTAEDVKFTLEYFVYSDPSWQYNETMPTDIKLLINILFSLRWKILMLGLVENILLVSGHPLYRNIFLNLIKTILDPLPTMKLLVPDRLNLRSSVRGSIYCWKRIKSGGEAAPM
jgi:hypothetical protein